LTHANGSSVSPAAKRAEISRPGNINRTARDGAIDQIDDLIDHFDVAMLVTRSLEGELRGRPMAIAGHDRGSMLYFLTRSDEEKLGEILRHSRVSVVMQGKGQYVSISGRARIETDRELIGRYWSAAARLWFPEGPEDPAATLVVVEPGYAECWDRSGLRRLEFTWEAGKALLGGEKAADDSLGGHGKARID